MMTNSLLTLPVQGELVSLREFTTDDVVAVHEIIGDDRVTKWLSFDSRSRDEAAQMITGAIERSARQPRDEWYLAVETKNRPALVGFARLAAAGVRAGKLGYSIAYEHWGKGYATDAAQAMIRFGFDELGLHRISAAIGPENTASIRVAKNLGMKHEGRIRDHVFTNGRWRDSDLYSILAEEQ